MHIKDYHINIFYSEEDGGYIADVPDLQVCSAFGETPAEALAEVERAKEGGLAGGGGGRETDSAAQVPTGYLSGYLLNVLLLPLRPGGRKD